MSLAALKAAPNLLELGHKLSEMIENAQGPHVEWKVLTYLQVAQQAIGKLGRERQGILSEAAGCDIRRSGQVEALAERMRVYLLEDNVRGPLTRAIAGLRQCGGEMERAADGILKWRKRDKQKAVHNFFQTLAELERETRSLQHKYFPGYSGQGLQTLRPLYEFVVCMKDSLNRRRPSDMDADEEKLGELIQNALRDPANRGWLEYVERIEERIVELQLAFSVKSEDVISSKLQTKGMRKVKRVSSFVD